jgi:hypothetical protein
MIISQVPPSPHGPNSCYVRCPTVVIRWHQPPPSRQLDHDHQADGLGRYICSIVVETPAPAQLDEVKYDIDGCGCGCGYSLRDVNENVILKLYLRAQTQTQSSFSLDRDRERWGGELSLEGVPEVVVSLMP